MYVNVNANGNVRLETEEIRTMKWQSKIRREERRIVEKLEWEKRKFGIFAREKVVENK